MNIDTTQLLTQLRLAAAQAKGITPPSAAPAETQGANFSSLLKQSLESVNGLQQTSAQMKTSFEMGDPNVTLPDVMLASSKADLAFQATVQVRNKLVEAYQEIMRMQV